jgi:hypothetical protein
MRNSREKRFEGTLFSVFALSHFFSVCVLFFVRKGARVKNSGMRIFSLASWLEQRCPTLSSFATCGVILIF